MKRLLLPCCLAALMVVSGCSDDDEGTILVSGVIEGTDIRVSAEAAGKLRSVPLDEGDRVLAGDTIAVIDDTEYRIQLRQAEANLRVAEAQLNLAVEGARKEDILQAETAYRAAETDYRRMENLLASGTVTQRQYDEAYTRYIAAQQTYEKLIAGSRDEELAAARARRELAAAQVDQLLKRTADCAIVAPSAGTVTARAVEPGELVMTGSYIVRLTRLDTVKLTVYLNQLDLAAVSLGQEASILIDGSDQEFTGTIISISDIAEFTPKNVQTREERTKLVYAVKIRIPNPDGVLKPGMPADARISVRMNL